MNDFKHISVLLKESVDGLQVQPGEWYIDATLGGGGHTREILNRGGKVLGIDQDQAALEFVQENQSAKITDQSLILEEGNFGDVFEIAKKHDLKGAVAGVLFDLGVSSFQIDQSGRGFSIRRDEPLDMRMSAQLELTAEEMVNHWAESELAEIFIKYGEEERGGLIAQAIVERRKIKKFETSHELAQYIEQTVKRSGQIHPATRVFMALRIVVNQELDVLKSGLVGAFEVLKPGGRMSVISFHSLEDRIVKQSFRDFEKKGATVVTKKPISAGDVENQTNRRARSAKLRILGKK